MTAASRLVLASRSPQRGAILTQLGVEFESVTPAVTERESGRPVELVEQNARAKALAVAADPAYDARTVIGVDTAVVLGSEVMGKPADAPQARAFLATLSGRTHQVYSGIAVVRPSCAPADDAGRRDLAARTAVSHAVTDVRFRPLTDELLDWYVALGEWRDRAGGYAIQERGALLVESIRGEYLNVVGLPVNELFRLAPDVLFQA